jgi:hypothetical protein
MRRPAEETRPLDRQAATGRPADDRVPPLERLLGDLDQSVPPDIDHVPLGAVVDAIGPRGFGPVLVAVAGLIILPTGMVPLVPHAVAVVLGLVAIQMMLGGTVLRLPARVRRVQVPAPMITGFVRRARRVARPLSRVLRPRLTWLATARPARVLVALVLLSVAIAKFLIGLIPGLPFLLAVPVLLIGLGLTSRDGIVLGAGLLVVLLPGAMVLRALLGVRAFGQFY